MTTKVRYTLSAIERDKAGLGWHVRAIPNAYAETFTVNFESEEEALIWLDRDSRYLARKAGSGAQRETPTRH